MVTMGLAFIGGAVVFRAASPSWPVLPRVVDFGGVSREAPLRPQPASLRLLRVASSRDYPLAAPFCAVSCSLDRVQPSSSVPPWYGWVTHSNKYHSSLCSVAQRVRGNENWQEGDRPPDAKVQCALCRDKERRTKRSVPVSERHERRHIPDPTTVRFFCCSRTLCLSFAALFPASHSSRSSPLPQY